jgi:hypothetical protein
LHYRLKEGMKAMSEPDDSQPADVGSGGFLALIEQFDWLKIPGAVRAVAHFVTGIADAGTAWVDIAKAKGQEHAQKIRDRTAARKSIMATTARAAGVQAAQSPERLDRMIDRLVAEELKRQENREAIAIEAGGLLDEVPRPQTRRGLRRIGSTSFRRMLRKQPLHDCDSIGRIYWPGKSARPVHFRSLHSSCSLFSIPCGPTI